MTDRGGKPWFAVKRFGYGAGMPVAWQGWAVLVGGIGAIVAAGLWLCGMVAVAVAVGVQGVVLAAIVVLAARHTAGGRWRWGA